MARIRLTRPEMAGFTSFMGTVKFENGVSVDHVAPAEQRLLAAITSVELIEDDGTVSATGDAHMMAQGRGTPAPIVNALQRIGDTPKDDAQTTDPAPEPTSAPEPTLDEMEAEASAEGGVATDQEAAEPRRIYTREELEVVADNEGIRGLRKIGEPLGARNVSIAGLITEILQQQSGQS